MLFINGKNEIRQKPWDTKTLPKCQNIVMFSESVHSYKIVNERIIHHVSIFSPVSLSICRSYSCLSAIYVGARMFASLVEPANFCLQ